MNASISHTEAGSTFYHFRQGKHTPVTVYHFPWAGAATWQVSVWDLDRATFDAIPAKEIAHVHDDGKRDWSKSPVHELTFFTKEPPTGIPTPQIAAPVPAEAGI